MRVERGQRRGVVVNFALALFSAAIALAVLEACLRLRAVWQPPRRYEQFRANTLRLHQRSDDPQLVYELRPGAAVTRRNGITYRVNAQGLRSDEDIPRKERDERRIVLLGDSVAFGFDLHEAQTFAHLLGQELDRLHPRTRVLNQAVIGYKTTQEVRLFERNGWALEPDAVVVAFCLNDFDDYSAQLSLIDPSIHLPVGGFRRLAPRRIAGLELAEPLPVLDRSLLFRAVAERLLRPEHDYYQWIGTHPQRRAEVAAALDRLGRSLSLHGIPGLVVIIPLLLEPGPYPYEEIHQFVARNAVAAGLQVLDLRARVPADEWLTARLQPTDVLHPNARGHEIIARALLPCLRDPALRCP